MESEYGVAGAKMALMRFPVYLDDLGIRLRLTEFDRRCFPISAHRAFIGSLFVIDAICWFDARQETTAIRNSDNVVGQSAATGTALDDLAVAWCTRQLLQAGTGLSATDACGQSLGR